MAVYLVQFGAGNPASFTGLTPTFIVFNAIGVGNTTPPSISEVTTSGLYTFSYAPLSAIAFVMDGTATITIPSNRYVSGLLTPDYGLSGNAVGVSVAAIVGGLTDSFGTTLAEPTTIVGFLKRMQEFNEGNNVFTKSSGQLEYWSRGVTYAFGSSVYSGSSAMLITKVVTDSGSVITKS